MKKNLLKLKETKTLLGVALGVVLFCIGLRFVVIGDFQKAPNLSDYKEQTVEIIDKQQVHKSDTKTTYTVTIAPAKESTKIELGKEDYNNLTVGDSIYILLSPSDIQLGTKEHPYTVIKVQD